MDNSHKSAPHTAAPHRCGTRCRAPMGPAQVSAGQRQAFLLLRTVFTIAPIVFGLDKFANVLVDWPPTSRRGSTTSCPGSAQQAMYAVGVIEIVAGSWSPCARASRPAGRRLAGRHHRQPRCSRRLLRRRPADSGCSSEPSRSGPAGDASGARAQDDRILRAQVRHRRCRPGRCQGGRDPARGASRAGDLGRAETQRPYERPPLSKGYLRPGRRARGRLRPPRGWYAEHDVEVRTGTRVTALDPDAHEMRSRTVERIVYDRLLLATGAPPHARHPRCGPRRRLLPADVADTERLRDLIAAGRPARGHGRRLDRAGGRGGRARGRGRGDGGRAAAAAAACGARPRARAGLRRAAPRPRGRPATSAPSTRSRAPRRGQRRAARRRPRPADTVVIGVGARPNTELAEAAGLAVDNGVDATRGPHQRPDIFAAGDIANVEHPFLGRRLRVEHWANAQRPAGVAAAHARSRTDPTGVPYFFTDQYDLGMEYTGLGGPTTTVVVRGDLGAREFIAFWLRDGRVRPA